MTWISALLAVPGTFALSTVAAWLSPWRVDARVVPAIMTLTALVVLLLPLRIEVALAVVPAVAWLHRACGISLTGHDPVNYSPAVGKARTMIDHTVATVLRRTKPPVPIEVQEFATRPYPSPADAVPDDDAPADGTVQDEDAGAGSDETVQDKVAALREKIRAFNSVPGQRPAMRTPAMSSTGVPSFVPRL